MIVMKFGGTSVGDAERLRAVAEIVAGRRSLRPVVVVSALGGVTDLLERSMDAAVRGDREAVDATLADLERRHRWTVSGGLTGDARHDVTLELDRRFDDLRQLLRAVRWLGELTPRARDRLYAFGEMLSARIAQAVFREAGIDCEGVDSRDVVVTDAGHGAARVALDATAERARRRLVPLVEHDRVPILGGFYGADPSGAITTLGRGGSDTSAAVLAASLEAERLEIWTDVAGFMTADPRLCRAATPLQRISLREAAAMAVHGARVLHPGAAGWALRHAIPVRILCTMKPDAEGTRVTAEPEADAPPLAGVASRTAVCTVEIGVVGHDHEPSIGRRVHRALGGLGRAPELCLGSELGWTVVTSDRDVERELAGLEQHGCTVRIAPGKAVVTLVGHGVAGSAAVRGEATEALAALRPQLIAADRRDAVSAVLDEARLPEAVRRLHRRFFETAPVREA